MSILLLLLSFLQARDLSISVADRLFQKRIESGENAKMALAIYRELVTQTPTSGELQWKLSMTCQYVGFRLTSDLEEKKKLYAEGREAGRKSLQLMESCAPCAFWTALNMALYGDAVGPFKTFISLKEIRELLEKTIEWDPAYGLGGGYRILGIIDQKLPGVLGGSNQRAENYFKQAIAVVPKEPLNYLFLAKFYWEEKEERQTALQILQEAKRKMVAIREVPESFESVAQIDELLHTLK